MFILCLLLIVVIAPFAIVAFASVERNVSMSGNFRDIVCARHAAESGMGFLLRVLDDVRMRPETDAGTLTANLGAQVHEILEGTGNLGGGAVTWDAAAVRVPAVRLDDGEFTATLVPVVEADGTLRCRLVVVGTHAAARCQTSIVLNLVKKQSRVFDYGVASRGAIHVTGSALIEGKNFPQAASVLSASDEPVAVEVGGSATISGDIYVTGDSDTVVLKGNSLSVGGESNLLKIMENHVHGATDDPQFPPLDLTPFPPLVKRIVDSTTSVSGGQTWNNIRIKAGTNPNFGSQATFNGIVYVESPNSISFEGGCTLNCIIVTDGGGGGDTSTNRLNFRGSVNAPGISALPNTAEFAAVKALGGTLILAPGYNVTFRGSSNNVSGILAADQLSFAGNSSITTELKGTVLGLRDLPMSLSGNATIRINHGDWDGLAAGFRHPWGLTEDPGSYVESPLP